MPEGDAVFRACRRLHAALAGRTLTRAELRVPAYATADLVGAEVVEVVPRGKHQLIRLSDGRTLRTHLRLDGSWRTLDTGQRWPGPDHMIRVVLQNSEHTAIGLRIHDIAIVPTTRESELVGHLGPDLLGPDWDLDEALRRLTAQPDRTIGEALLDQRNLAGIGTIYRAESLFLQGIHPRTPLGTIEPAKLRRLVVRAQLLLRANLDRSDTLTTGRDRPGQRTWTFERAGRPCLRCGTRIEHEEFGPQGQERHSYWCPHCQGIL
ncbi:Fpg/Nei family DNA glycosylase [Mariniluteicoccus flavus]